MDGVKTLTLALVFVVWSVTTILAALLSTSPLMEQVTRGCVVEQEDTRRELALPLPLTSDLTILK